MLSPTSLRAARAAALAPALAGLLAVACRTAPTPAAGVSTSPTADSLAIRRDVEYLASDRLEGRGTGTPGNDSAAAYIARRFQALGLSPAVTTGDSTACAGPRLVLGAAVGPGEGTRVDRSRCRGYLQPFTARSIALAHAGRGGLATQNVAALLPGTDPALRDEYLVLGAHFDHLGRATFGALDPQAGDSVRNGADDNASGTAVVMELARLLRRTPTRRSVVFVAFSGEELGLLGSQHFVEHAPVPLERVQAMLNFDMVGRLRPDRGLLVYGVATAAELPGVVNAANVAPQVKLTTLGDGFGPSDHSSFYAKGVPVLHFFTDLHPDYHRASDDPERLDAAGAARVAALAERVVRDLADRPARLTFTRGTAPAPQATTSNRSNVYFGSIPDMSAGDAPGLRITGVSPGSPAEAAGLKAGDVIVEFGGAAVKDLYAYTDALYARKPGDVVQVVVVRGGERQAFTVTLGRRGQ